MDNYNKLRNEAATHQQSPPKGAWEKIEGKLDYNAYQNRSRKRKLLNFLMSLAALCMLLFICIFVYQETDKSPELSKGNIANWEELDLNADQFYNVAKVQGLNAAYRKTTS